MNYLREEERTTRGKREFNLTLVLLIIIAILIAVIATILLWPEDEEEPNAVIAECLVDVDEYTCQKYYYNYVDQFEDSREVFDIDIPLTVKSFVYSIPGMISYGFDMSEIEEDNIKVNNQAKKITIDMPEMYILSHEQFSENMQFYAEEKSIFNPLRPEDVKGIEVEAKAKSEAEAKTLGVIEEAQDNAQKNLQALLTALPEYGGYTVKCNFDKQDEVKHIEDVRLNNDESKPE